MPQAARAAPQPAFIRLDTLPARFSFSRNVSRWKQGAKTQSALAKDACQCPRCRTRRKWSPKARGDILFQCSVVISYRVWGSNALCGTFRGTNLISRGQQRRVRSKWGDKDCDHVITQSKRCFLSYGVLWVDRSFYFFFFLSQRSVLFLNLKLRPVLVQHWLNRPSISPFSVMVVLMAILRHFSLKFD